MPKIVIKENALPIYFIHFVTSRCNAKCPHCFIFAENDTRFSDRNLSIDEIKQIAKSFRGKLFNLALTGGEPFLRNDIEQICESYIKYAGVKTINIFSNGYLQERIFNAFDSLTSTYPSVSFVCSISIDDLHNRHSEYRKLHDGFNKALKTYELVKSLKRTNLVMDIGLTVSSANQDRLMEIYDHLVLEKRIRTLSCTLVRGNPLDPKTLEVDENKYRAFSKRIDDGLKNGELDCFKGFAGSDLLNAKSIVMRDLIPKTIEKGFQSPCYAGRLTGVMYSNGDVYPCELLESKKIGNVRDYNFSIERLWFSENAKAIKKWIYDTKCHCTHECFLTVNILFNLKYYPKLIKEYAKIKFGSEK